jgi:hypothetical protein
MSRIYAGGVKATAIANILADIATYISYNTAGQLVLDTQGLQTYLRGEFLTAASTEFVAPATATTATAAAQSYNVATLVEALNDVLRVEHWSGRADFPTAVDVLTGGAHVTAVRRAMDEMERRTQEITNLYNDFNNRIAEGLTAKFYQFGLDAVVPPGVDRIVDTRFYRYTYVTDRGEESAPSPISDVLEVDQNDTVSFTASAAPAGRNITHFRPYRSAVGNESKEWRYVRHASDTNGWPIGTLAITDNRKAEELSDVLQTLTWAEPPADAHHVIQGPNGGQVVLSGNAAYPCVNYHPYAYPFDYKKSFAWPAIGGGCFGSTYVILTRGRPYYLTGADSASLDSQMIDSDQSCIATRGIVNVPGGVMFPSNDGWCLADASGIRVITGPGAFDLFDRESWAALNPSTIHAAFSDGVLLWSCTGGSASGMYALSIMDGKLTKIDGLTPTAFFRDLLSDTLYAAEGTTIKSLFTSASKRTAVWKSPRIVLPAFTSMAWAQADSDYGANLTVKSYGNGTLLATTTLSDRKAKRHPHGREREWEVQVEGAINATSVTLASSTEELKAV